MFVNKSEEENMPSAELSQHALKTPLIINALKGGGKIGHEIGAE